MRMTRISALVTLAWAVWGAAGPGIRPARAVPPPPPDPALLRAPTCPLWYAPGEPIGLFPHPEPASADAGPVLSEASGWSALVEARGWVEVGRAERALPALDRAPDGPAKRLYRLAALDALERWEELGEEIEETPADELPAGCAPLRDLWSARAATAAGDGPAADRAFEALDAGLPDLGGWLDLLRLEAAALSGDLARGEAAWSRIQAGSLPMVARSDGRRVLPAMYARAGRLESAIGLHLVLADAARGAERARHWLEAARLAERLGQSARADELRRRAVVHEPAHAGELLLDSDLRARLGIGALESAEILVQAGRPAEAVPFATAVIEAGGAEDAQRATLARARARAAAGDRDGAERDYAAFLSRCPSDPRAADAAFERARLALRSDDGEVARQRLREFLARWPSHARADDVAFLIADSHHDEWDGGAEAADVAIEAFDGVAATRRGSFFAQRAVMRAAHLSYAAGRFAEAERRYRAYRGPESREARYWRARALHRLGQNDEARAVWRELASAGDEYYALLSRERLRGGAGLAALLPSGYAPAPDPGWVSRGDVLLEEPGGRTAAALLALGRRGWAHAELERLMAGGEREARLARAAALEAWGFPDLALRIGVAGGGTRWAFPAGYRSAIEREVREHGLDGAYVMALIRQESMFRATAVSPVGARGLMQVMPRTGREIADMAGWPDYDSAILFQPAVSLHFGALYLEAQRNRFDDFWPAVLAAYNGGPHNVAVWIEFREAQMDPELWVERIPFRETRDYVKKIVGQWATYRRLYGSPPVSR